MFTRYLALPLASGLALTSLTHAAQIDVTSYPSIQAAIDANPGAMLYAPPGDYFLDDALRITTDATGLYGHGRIIQRNPDANILTIDGARSVRIHGLTFERAQGHEDATQHGILATDAADVDLRGVRVINNRSQAGAIQFQRVRGGRIRDCEILNYKRIAVDDRTGSELYGYAFRVIDGSGVVVTSSQGIQILDNRVVEQNIFPTQETRERYNLGAFTEGRRPLNRGRLAPQGDYANNWHQGSAIVITAPLETDHILVRGNYIENAAQGIDIHADHVTCAENIITHAFIGIKCMHGSKNVIISANNLSHNDLWGIVMMPGTASHPAQPAADGAPPRPANFTSGNLIANNIFSDFGYGYEYFNWKDGRTCAISLESGQLPENPVMTDVLVTGNIIYDTGKDGILVDGVPVKEPPRYRYAVYIDQNPAPQGLRFAGNIFQPGSEGVSNMAIEDLARP